MVTLAMTDYWLYACPFSEKFMFLSPDIKRVRFLWGTWNQHLRVSTLVLTSIASVSGNVFDWSSIYASDLSHGFVNSMTIILIPERHGSDDKPIPQR